MILGFAGFYGANAILHFQFAHMTMDPFAIAITNTVYRAVTMTLMLPVCGGLEKLIFRLLPDTQADQESTAEFDLLEDRFLSNPDVAYEQSMIVMNGMAKKARKNVDRALRLLEDFSPDGYRKVGELEQTLNKYEDKLGSYLIKLTGAGRQRGAGADHQQGAAGNQRF